MTDTALPLVSCLCVTEDRPAFMPWLLWNYDRQSWARRELVVLDSSAAPLQVAGRDDVRVIAAPHGTGVARKRNLALQEARGEIVTWFDDDDWQHPDKVAWLVGALSGGVPFAGTWRGWFVDLESLRCTPYRAHKRQIVFNSAGFIKQIVLPSAFPEYVEKASDTRWMEALSTRFQGAAARLDREAMFFWLCHQDNLSNPSKQRTFDRPLETLKTLIGSEAWGDTDDALQALRERLHLGNVALASHTEMRQAIAPMSSIGRAHPGSQDRGNGAARSVAPTTPADLSGQEAQAAHARVTVSIPYYGCKQHIRRAVESILAQTYDHLALIVVNDGDPDAPWDQLADIPDPRLVRFNLNSNHGRYFADQVVLNATADPYFMIQDADDWSEPERIAALLYHLRAEYAVGAVSAQQDHNSTHPRDGGTLARTNDIRGPLDATFKLRIRHHGLFRTDALRAIGGYYGGFRIAYDMLLTNLLLMTGRLAFVDRLLYHRTIRPGSLTTATITGMRSTQRQNVSAKLGQLYAEAWHAYRAYLEGDLAHKDLCARIYKLSRRYVSPEESAGIAAESQRLRELFESAATPKPIAVATAHAKSSGALIDDPRLSWTGWSIDKTVAQQMQQYLQVAKPQRVLEIGSGMSTVLLADYAARHQATLVSLGHEPVFQDQVSDLLQVFGLREHVDLRSVPLTSIPCPGGHSYPWYDTELRGPFDFVFIDGPPMQVGRQATFFVIAPHMAEHWGVWLHDAARAHEQECVALWSRYFAFQQELSHPEPRGLLKMSAFDTLPMPGGAPSRLGISLLTGGRIGLLKRTIDALQTNRSDLLEQSLVVALVNGHDPETLSYIQSLPFVDQCLQYDKGVLPIGDAATCLIQALLAEGVEMVLHLEDDWETGSTDPQWLERAWEILNTRPTVGQVRLRHRDEKVLPYHMITREPIRWERQNGFMVAPRAHFTFNPSLIRAHDAARIFPCRTEHDAQIRFLRLGLATVQLLPGAFHHTGAHQSRQAAHRAL